MALIPTNPGEGLRSPSIEIGGDEKKLYEGVAAAVKAASIDRFIGIGEALTRQKSTEPDVIFKSRYRRLRSYTFGMKHYKGARIYGFERISSLLVRQLHQTRLEINMDRVHNLIVRHRGLYRYHGHGQGVCLRCGFSRDSISLI
ncbi:MAG: hypothetical protein U5L72_13965 [Bacteroidales bacterium]|nr:hypothetical protein [Bacteroidales bacterium]